jgi:two-component SAPR family response regulator
MKVLIVEDEYGVAQNLKDLLLDLEPDTQIMCILESVEEAVAWINENPKPDLGFFDIRLADGSSFEIFEKVKLTFPIIFTTAFDEFAIKAFKVNSIDYLLKPIGKEEIKFSLNKYKSLYGPGDSELNTDSKEIEKGQEQLLNVINV